MLADASRAYLVFSVKLGTSSRDASRFLSVVPIDLKGFKMLLFVTFHETRTKLQKDFHDT